MNTQKIDDVNVAAMLFTIGFTQDRKAIQLKKRNGKVKFVYFFKSRSECGEYQIKECLEAWGDDLFVEQNPFHPLSVIKAHTHNRNQLLSEIKSGAGTLTEVEHGSGSALINLAASTESLEGLCS